jgi:hypothetical protein
VQRSCAWRARGGQPAPKCLQVSLITDAAQTPDKPRHAARAAPHAEDNLSRVERYFGEVLDELSTWFLQYFFISLFDIPELLAFCCAMQSFICSFFAACSLVLLARLLLDGDVELGSLDGVWLDGMVPEGGVDCDCMVLCAMAMPAAPRTTNANAPVTRFTGPSFDVYRRRPTIRGMPPCEYRQRTQAGVGDHLRPSHSPAF